MNKIIIVMVALAALCFSATQAGAALQVGSKVNLDTSLPGDRGGQFLAKSVPANLPDKGFTNFITFCAELEQTIGTNGTYTVTGFGTQNTSGKTLGDQAAYLYTNFIAGNFGETGAAFSAAKSNGLQYGIWQGMGYSDTEIRNLLGISQTQLNNTYLNNWNTYAFGDSDWMGDFGSWSGIGNVRVLQLGNNQDQLVMVPEASTIAVWSVLSLLGAGVAYRKRIEG